jgi:hypothetical protein
MKPYSTSNSTHCMAKPAQHAWGSLEWEVGIVEMYGIFGVIRCSFATRDAIHIRIEDNS